MRASASMRHRRGSLLMSRRCQPRLMLALLTAFWLSTYLFWGAAGIQVYAQSLDTGGSPPNDGQTGMGAGGFASDARISTPLEGYVPAAELLDPAGPDRLETRAVAEKDGFAYLLTRSNKLHVYDSTNLPALTGFATYAVPITSRTLSNGNGLLRRGDYIYAYGYSGLEILNAQNPSAPFVVGSRYDFQIRNAISYGSQLIAVGAETVGIYSVVNAASPVLISTFSLGAANIGFSAAVYASILYVSQFQSGDLNTGINVIGFSDPLRLSLIRFISTNEVAYHLQVHGDRLVGCNSNSLDLWSLNTPASPNLLASVPANARVCARDRDSIVTNGQVFTISGSGFSPVATFDPVGRQIDGFPYGSAVNADLVFLAQSTRILILRAAPTPLPPVFLPLVLRQVPQSLTAPSLNPITPPDHNPAYTVQWSAVPGAQPYILERATSPAFGDATQLYNGTATQHFADSAGIATYHYRVKARSSSGDSDWSNAQSVPVRWEREPNGEAADATGTGPLQSGRVHYGTLTSTDERGNDYFYFDLPSSRPVELWLTHMAGDQDFNLVLRDASLVIVSGGFSGNPGSWDEHIATDLLPTGRYYVQVNRVTGDRDHPYYLRGTW